MSMLPPPSYPTPLSRSAELSRPGYELWIKNDGPTHPLYGGNKARKAVNLLREAERRGARRILTIGAVGSHHVLTTAVFAKAAGIGCAAVLIPQPRTEHVVETIRASLGQGLECLCTQHQWGVPFRLLLGMRSGDYFVPPGGSSSLGAMAYVDAVGELSQQLERDSLPEPDIIVVPLGSGGTTAGIAAGILKFGLRSRVLGVQVVPGVTTRLLARRLARSLLGELDLGAHLHRLDEVLCFDETELGQGYGFETPAGARATQIAAGVGLQLDPTYTSKAFAAVLRMLDSVPPSGERAQRILYWHTLATTSLEPLLHDAPDEASLPASVRALLR